MDFFYILFSHRDFLHLFLHEDRCSPTDVPHATTVKSASGVWPHGDDVHLRARGVAAGSVWLDADELMCRCRWFRNWGVPWSSPKWMGCWLVVWNINVIFPSIGNNHPNWLYNTFQRGWNHQPGWVHGIFVIQKMDDFWKRVVPPMTQETPYLMGI